MRRIKTLSLFVCLSILATLIVKPGLGVRASVAQRDSTLSDLSTSCYSLDLVFLIDQSDSMSGYGGNLASDPQGLSINSVDWVINWLGDNVLGSCPAAVHRIAVVSWGGSVEVDIEPTQIAPQNTPDWITQREKLKAEMVVKHLGFTKPDLAFQKAKDYFDSFANQPLGDLPRKRAIIFLTDGNPQFVEGQLASDQYMKDLRDRLQVDFPFDTTLLQQEQCISVARDQAKQAGLLDIKPEDLNKCLTTYPVGGESYENSTYIYSVLLNSGHIYSDNNYTSIKQISESHGGQVMLLANNNDIPTRFLTILTGLSGVKVTKVGCESFPVEPYLQQAAFSFFKADKDIDVEISYERDGQKYTITQQIYKAILAGH